MATLCLSIDVDAFHPSVPRPSAPCYTKWDRRRRRSSRDTEISSASSITTLFSSVGGDNRPPPGGGGNNDDNDGGLEEFLDPSRKKESENLKRAREFMSEASLPISFDQLDAEDASDDEASTSEDSTSVTETTDDPTATDNATPSTSELDTSPTATSSSSLASLVNASSAPPPSSPVNSATSSALFGTNGSSSQAPSSDILAKNPYMQVVSRISPSELISKFTATANPRVQEAVRTTILGLIGSLPKLAFETTSITTGQRLASLMFQLQMTGYMFKNAEYRMSMSQSLGMYGEMSSKLLLSGVKEEELKDTLEDLLDRDEDDPLVSGKIKGKLKVRYGRKSPETSSDMDQDGAYKDDNGMEIEVDAAAYMSELRAEVSKLRDELSETKESKEAALQQDLLLFIRTLPAQELKSLTNTMSQDVLVCMKGLVQAVLAGIGDGQIGPDTVTEQSGEAMAQLCMWQLAVGYNLRELEVREEMRKNLSTILGESSNTDGGSANETKPGAFE